MPGLCNWKLSSIMPQALRSLGDDFQQSPGTPLTCDREAQVAPADASEMPSCRDLGLAELRNVLPTTSVMAEALSLNRQCPEGNCAAFASITPMAEPPHALLKWLLEAAVCNTTQRWNCRGKNKEEVREFCISGRRSGERLRHSGKSINGGWGRMKAQAGSGYFRCFLFPDSVCRVS